MMEAVHLNANAVRQCDVLIRREEYVAGEMPVEQVSVRRLIIDKDKEQVLSVGRSKKTWLANNEVEESVAQWALRVDGKRCARVSANQDFAKTCESFLAACIDGRIPALDRIGVAQFPSVPRLAAGEKMDTWWATRFRILATAGRSRISESATTVFYESIGGSPPGRTYESEWKFDNGTLTPNSYVFTAVQQQDGGEPLRQKFCDERYSWVEHEGVYLPVSILADALNAVNQEENSITEFYWLSVNQPVKQFTLDDIRDPLVMEALLNDSVKDDAVVEPAKR